MPTLPRTALVRLGQIAVTFVLYAVCNKLALTFEVENGVSILFPATAVSILTCMTFGPWAAIGIILGTIATPWGENADLPSLIISGATASLEGLIPWAVFRYRKDLHNDLRDMKSFVAFLIFGCILNNLVSAVVGNLFVVSHPGGLRLVWEEIFVWFIADFTAALLLATPVLAFGVSLLGRRDREPRTLVNALQILSVVVLLGWAAAFAIRTYLTSSLENEQIHQQRDAARAETIINQMHSNFLRAAFILPTDPQKLVKFDTARKTHDAYLENLRKLIGHASPELTKQFPRIATDSRKWFSDTRFSLQSSPSQSSNEMTAHVTGREILELRGMMERANSAAWLLFSTRRHKITIVAGMVDALVLLILVLATLTLLLNVSKPLAQLRAGISSMRDGHPFEARRIDGRHIEFRSLAETIEETDRALTTREEELRLQTDRAVAASKHKSDFLAKMSHELRTPLNSIIGFSELLLEQDDNVDPVRRHAFLDNVSSSAHRLLGLINDLLDISKVEAGKMPMRFEAVDLRHTIANTVATTAPLFDRKRQQVAVSVPKEPMLVRADPARVEQVLLNLLSNANKFTPEGERIEIRTGGDAGRWHIAIADRGIGISPSDQIRIFEDFEQVHTTGVLSNGTGLGLALAKRFVEAHGGTIDVESSVGNGSVFRVSLPRMTVV
jgi:signal transduction histidine kinase